MLKNQPTNIHVGTMAADVDFFLGTIILLLALTLTQCQSIKEGVIEDAGSVWGEKEWMHAPTVFVSLLVRNKAHTLPWFLYYLQALDYPKQRMRLWYDDNINFKKNFIYVCDSLGYFLYRLQQLE